MKKWKPRTNSTNIPDAVEKLSGYQIQELLNPPALDSRKIQHLQEAAELIRKAISDNQKITVIGDYDTDGVTATAILFLLLKKLGLPPAIRLPHRMSEGYGLSEKIVNEVLQTNRDGLLITVDNGVAAHDAIKKAKDAGLTIIVLDHHLPGQELPPADVLVDQWVYERENTAPDHCYYCGAGLAYKLAQLMLPADDKLLKPLCALAAIGTVADVIPLTKDNRIIVRDGLKNINVRDVTKGLACILDVSGKAQFDATTLAFYIVPMINAAGRLLDDGARFPCAILAAEGNVLSHAEKLKTINEQRKEMVKVQYQCALGNLNTDSGKHIPVPIIVFSPDVHEGIAGILAGKLVEDYHVPAFVFARTKSHWKGSARSIAGVNLKEHLDHIKDTMLGYGGHAGAAGISIEFGKEEIFRTAAEKEFFGIPPADTTIDYYDVTLSESQVAEAYQQQLALEPFGEGCPKPVVRVNHCHLLPMWNGNLAFFMGKNEEHLKLKCADFSIIGFFMADEFKKTCQNSGYVDVIGELEMNISQYGKELQINAKAILPGQ